MLSDLPCFSGKREVDEDADPVMAQVEIIYCCPFCLGELLGRWFLKRGGCPGLPPLHGGTSGSLLLRSLGVEVRGKETGPQRLQGGLGWAGG